MRQYLRSGNAAHVRVAGTRRPVTILAVAQDTIGVTYPFEPFPEAGTVLDLEFDDAGYVACYCTQVVVAPVDKEDGMILQRAPSRTYMERRRTWRVPLVAEVALRRQGDLDAYAAAAINVSTEGVLIESDAPFHVYDTVEVTLPLKGGRLEDILGRIVRVVPAESGQSAESGHSYESGFGVWFVALSREARKVLTLYIWQRLRELCPEELRALFPGSGKRRKKKRKPPPGPATDPNNGARTNDEFDSLSKEIEESR